MIKPFSSRIEVRVDEKKRPLAFSMSVRGRHQRVNYRVVQILSWWREPGRWWEGEPVTLFLRLQAVPMVERGDKQTADSNMSKPQTANSKQGIGEVQSTVYCLQSTVEPAGVGLKPAHQMPRIFELYRAGEGWYFHRLLG